MKHFFVREAEPAFKPPNALALPILDTALVRQIFNVVSRVVVMTMMTVAMMMALVTTRAIRNLHQNAVLVTMGLTL